MTDREKLEAIRVLAGERLRECSCPARCGWCLVLEGILSILSSPESEGEAEKALGNLLAVIHRDGGHYQAEHGTEKAAKDAEAVVLADRARKS